MFKKRLLNIWLLLSVLIIGAGTAFAEDNPDVTYDFTGTGWTASNGKLTNGTVTFEGSGEGSFKMNSGYFILGKKDAYINFPKYSNAVEKIVITGRTGASSDVKQNIFVDGTAVSTETTGATSTNTYEIAEQNQAAGTQYTFKVTSKHNTQITKIEIYFVATSDPAKQTPELSFPAASYTAELSAGFTAPALSNTSNVAVTYSSSKESVATVNATTGAVTLVAAGKTTITASFAGDDTYSSASASYELTVTDSSAPQDEWVKTSIADLAEGDVFVIVGKSGDNYYALSNDKGTSSAPTAVKVTVESDNLTSEVAENIKWNISGTADNYVFYPNGSTATWLYCTNTNNGVRVGTNDSKTFKISTDYLFHNGTSRYVGIYNDQDWRCYSSINSNIEKQEFVFFKKVDPSAPVDTRKATVTAFPESEYSITVGETFEAPKATVTVDGNALTGAIVAYSGNNDKLATVDATTGALTFVDGATGSITVTATYDGDDTNYKRSSGSYKLTVKAAAPVGSSTTYKKVTTTADITDGEYLIVYAEGNKAFNGALKTLDAGSNYVNVEIADNEIVGNDDIDAATFTIDTEAGTLKSASGLYIGVESNSNGLKQDTKATTYTNSFEIDTDGNAVIKAVFDESTMTMRFNKASNQDRFRYYKSGQEAVQLFKKEGGTSLLSNNIKIKTADGEEITSLTVNKGETKQVSLVVASNGQATAESANAEVAKVEALPTAVNLFSIEGVSGTKTGTTVDVVFSVEKTDTYKAATATLKVTVVDPDVVEKGTAENPYTVAEARAAIDAGQGVTGVYAKGIVSGIVTAYSSQYGNISYNISEDGTTTADQLQAYRGKSYNGKSFTSEDDIQVGDEVVIYGNLKKYNSIYEFDTNNQLVSLNRPADERTEVSITDFALVGSIDYKGDSSETTVEFDVEGVDFGVSYTSSDETVATVSQDGVVTAVAPGTATITATLSLTDEQLREYKPGETTSMSIEVTVNGEQYTVTFVSNGEEISSDDVDEDTEITFPTVTSTNPEYSFVGWTTTEITDTQDNAPADLVTKAVMGAADITYYAVFAKGNGATDVLDNALTGITGTSYSDWSGKTSNSDAVYAGTSAGGNSAIQLRSSDSKSGVVTTTSGGKLSKVSVEWNSNTASERKVDIYGSNTAYTAASDLYDTAKAGTKLGTLVCGGTTNELTIDGDYTYVGIRSNSSALYLDKITIVWGDYSSYCTTIPEPIVLQDYTLSVVDSENGTVEVKFNGKVATPDEEGNYTVTEGTQVTLTATPAEGYQFSGWAATIDDYDETANPLVFIMPADDVMAEATFEEIPKVDVMFVVAGEDGDAVTVEANTTLGAVKPSDPAAINDMPFAGWSLSDDLKEAAPLPDSYVIEDDAIFYALYLAQPGSNVYKKVTTTLDDFSGEYLIVTEEYSSAFNSSLEKLDVADNVVKVTIANNEIAGSADLDAAVFTISKTADAAAEVYTIKSSAGQYIGKTANSNGLDASDKTAYTNTISVDDNGDAVITSSGNCTLRYNKAEGQNRFRYYKSGQQAIQLYKKSAGSVIYSLGTETEDALISDALYATFHAAIPVSFAGEAVTVYTAKLDGNLVRLTEVADGIVPANTAVVLSSETEDIYELPVWYSAQTSLPDNDLKISDGKVSGENIYVLANKSKGVGFYPWTPTQTLSPGKVYIEVPADGSARDFYGFDDDATAIAQRLVLQGAAAVYDLQGRKIDARRQSAASQLQKGIYVIDGKKVIIK